MGIAIYSELGGNPAFTPLGIDQVPGFSQPGGNMEGKEVRFGIVPSAIVLCRNDGYLLRGSQLDA